MKMKNEKKIALVLALAFSTFAMIPAVQLYADGTGTATEPQKTITVTDTQTVDLDGDGKQETVTAEFADINEETGDSGYCIIKIGDKSITIPGYEFQPKMYIVDIDKSDSFKEIAVTDNGPSSDYVTHFCYFNKDVINMGKVPGSMSGALDYVEAYNNKEFVDTVEGVKECAVHTNGDGKVIGTPRGKLFQTWIYFNDYKLDGQHMLSAVKKSFYEAAWKNRLTVKKTVTVYGNDKKKVLMKLKKGDKVIFWGSDEKSFCKIKLKNGKFGWVKGNTGMTDEYFSGVFLAD